jgi:hypothetical protein
MPQNSPDTWPPPIYTLLPNEAAPDDPAKVARQQAALGWTFLLLSPLAPQVFLPYALFHGWKAQRSGETAQGKRILGIAALLTILLTGAVAWYWAIGH